MGCGRLARCHCSVVRIDRERVTETQAATPTIYGWIAIISTGGTPCSGCIAFSFPISIQSVASYSDGVTGTSPVVNATLVLYLPPSII